MGMIFQQFSLLNRKTVYQNIAVPMQCWNYPKDEIDKKVRDLLELVGLSDKMNAKPRNLSGGQKQRVAIARALSMDSKVLLCDEATSALDPKTTLSILELLKKINKERGITIIIVTHQMEVVRNACNKISILENGEIAAQGETKEIFAQGPKALQNLLGEENTKLPNTGRNIRISHYVNDISEGKFISQMSTDLNTIFSVIDGQILKYSDDKFGTFTINVTEEQFPIITKYLDDRNYEWREIVSNLDESEDDI